MVRNHAEEKREKARMVINYKKFNDNTMFDGYYIPNKTVLFYRIQGASWFSKNGLQKWILSNRNG